LTDGKTGAPVTRKPQGTSGLCRCLARQRGILPHQADRRCFRRQQTLPG